jgi:sugar lactone lactonase YvrE
VPATDVFLGGCQNIQFDAEGNLYVLPGGSQLHRVEKTGKIRTVAGTDRGGYGGDGGPAALALFLFPEGLAIDPSGSIYVGDTFNHRIRKINMPSRLIRN